MQWLSAFAQRVEVVVEKVGSFFFLHTFASMSHHAFAFLINICHETNVPLLLSSAILFIDML
jgi:hypothetical protein